MAFYDRDEVTETYTSTDYDQGYGYNRFDGPRFDDGVVTEETTTTYYDDDQRGPPPPPDAPWPWRARWDDGECRYFFLNENTGERRWDFPQDEVVTESTTYYDDDRRGEYTDDRVYESQDVIDERERRNDGMMYGAMGAAAGIGAGALVAEEAGRLEGDKWRMENDVEEGFDRVGDDIIDAPENVANWVGEKVGDVERYGDNIDYSYEEGKYEGREGW